MKYDVIIVGQGLAGSHMALELLKRNVSFAVVDDGWQTASSTVAAGIYHPMVFRKLTKSFMADTFIPFAEEVYHKFEDEMGQQLLYPRELWKILTSVEEQNNWEARRGEAGFKDILGSNIPVKKLPKGVKAPYGIGRVTKAANLDISTFLEGVFEQLVKKNAYIRGKTIEIAPLDRGWLVKTDKQTLESKRVILAKGNRAFFGGYFSYLPIGATKGDILEVEILDLSFTREVLNKNGWLLPQGNHRFKLGATYEWGNHDYQPSNEGRQQLIEKLKSIIELPYKIVGHYSGLRPTSGDRRPLLGEHPAHKGCYLFNGLGSKGVMMAPWCAHHLANHIFEGAELDEAVDIVRYQKHWKRHEQD